MDLFDAKNVFGTIRSVYISRSKNLLCLLDSGQGHHIILAGIPFVPERRKALKFLKSKAQIETVRLVVFLILPIRTVLTCIKE